MGGSYLKEPKKENVVGREALELIIKTNTQGPSNGSIQTPSFDDGKNPSVPTTVPNIVDLTKIVSSNGGAAVTKTPSTGTHPSDSPTSSRAVSSAVPKKAPSVDNGNGSPPATVIDLEQMVKKKLESMNLEEMYNTQCGIPTSISASNRIFKTILTLTLYPCEDEKTNNTCFKIMNNDYQKGISYVIPKEEDKIGLDAFIDNELKKAKEKMEEKENGDKIFRNIWDEEKYCATMQSIYLIGLSNPFSTELHFRLKDVFKNNASWSGTKTSSSAQKKSRFLDIVLPPNSNKCQYVDMSNQRDGKLENLTPLASGNSFKIFEIEVGTQDLVCWSGLKYAEHFAKRYFLTIETNAQERLEYELFHENCLVYAAFLKNTKSTYDAKEETDEEAKTRRSPVVERMWEVQRYVSKYLDPTIRVVDKTIGDVIHQKVKDFLSQLNRCFGDQDNAKLSYVCDSTTDNGFKEQIKTMSTKIISSKPRRDEEREGSVETVKFLPSTNSVTTITLLVSFVLSQKRIYLNANGVDSPISEEEAREMQL